MRTTIIAILLFCLSPAISYSETDEPQRRFFLQAKVKHDFPSATEMIGGLHLGATHSIEAELMHGEPTASAMGIGVGYQFFHEMGEHQQGEIAFMPVYFRVQGTLVHANKFSVYFGFRIGCNAVFLDGEYQDVYNIEGGKCFGVVLGCLVRNEILVEGSFTGLGGKLTSDSHFDRHLGVPQLSLGVGFLID